MPPSRTNVSIHPLSLRSRNILRVIACLPLLASAQARAAVLLDCDAVDSPLVCRLKSVLTGLETLAGILAILLILAILIAVQAYRRKKSKLTPEDLTRDVR